MRDMSVGNQVFTNLVMAQAGHKCHFRCLFLQGFARHILPFLHWALQTCVLRLSGHINQSSLLRMLNDRPYCVLQMRFAMVPCSPCRPGRSAGAWRR